MADRLASWLEMSLAAQRSGQIPYVAACPGCGIDAMFTSISHPDFPQQLLRVTVECPCCGPHEDLSKTAG